MDNKLYTEEEVTKCVAQAVEVFKRDHCCFIKLPVAIAVFAGIGVISTYEFFRGKFKRKKTTED